MFGAPAGGAVLAGHHGVESATVVPIFPGNGVSRGLVIGGESRRSRLLHLSPLQRGEVGSRSDPGEGPLSAVSACGEPPSPAALRKADASRRRPYAQRTAAGGRLSTSPRKRGE